MYSVGQHRLSAGTDIGGRATVIEAAAPVGEPEHEAHRQLIAVLRRELHQRVRSLAERHPLELLIQRVVSRSSFTSERVLLLAPLP